MKPSHNKMLQTTKNAEILNTIMMSAIKNSFTKCETMKIKIGIE